MAGLLGYGVSLAALVKGSVPYFRVNSRKGAAGALVGSLFLMGACSSLPPISDPEPESDSLFDIDMSSPTTSTQAARPPGVPPDAQLAVVARHVDGDTIWAEGGTLPPGTASRVRLLEIDAPEQSAPLAAEASALLGAEAPLGATIYLAADRGDVDRFGRYLRYVWKSDGEFVNEKMVRTGLARAILIAPNDRYIGTIRAAEREARAAGRGIWAAPLAADRSAPDRAAPAGSDSRPASEGDCHPSYPDFCIKPPPPDLDCSDIGRRLTVLPPDPHRLDGRAGQIGEPDGVGCESYP
ncbi:MAG: thermonuclease family protein [Actinomycetota bacterium]